MAAVKAWNKNNAGVKRIMREAAEMSDDTSSDYTAHPLEDDLFEWHCTMRGPAGTEFEGGLYHFRIILPSEYPFRPPSIIMLTPNGRFECGTKICISFTNYHEELWQPAWGVRTAIIGLQGFFPLKGEAAVGLGAVEYPESERRRLAQLSQKWTCPECKKCNEEILPPAPSSSTATESSTENRNAEQADQTSNRETEPPTQIQEVTPAQIQNSARALPVGHAQSMANTGNPSRPPIILDAAIGVIVLLIAALLVRRIL